MNLEKIQQNSLAGFLQEAILKQVQREDEIRFANEPRAELPKYVKPPKSENTVGWWVFSKSLARELLP